VYYFSDEELVRLLEVTYKRDRLIHLAVLTTVAYGLRISELKRLTVDNIWDHELHITASKGGQTQVVPLHASENPLLDLRLLAVHAHGVREAGGKFLFDKSRQSYDQKMKKYSAEALINPVKRHWHALRHASAQMVWQKSLSLGAVRQALRHKSWSASLIYLAEHDNKKSVDAMAQALGDLVTAI
jgi:integrase